MALLPPMGVTRCPPRVCKLRAPAPAPAPCLCCQQSFLPPFILVKTFQIYYVLDKLSVHACGWNAALVCGGALPTPPHPHTDMSSCISVGKKKKKSTWHLYCSSAAAASDGANSNILKLLIQPMFLFSLIKPGVCVCLVVLASFSLGFFVLFRLTALRKSTNSKDKSYE